MSFTQDTKVELTRIIPEKKCCQLAEIAGFLRFAGSITISGGRLGIKVTTDHPAIARSFITLIREYFGSKTALSLGEPMPFSRGRRYELNITPEMNAEQILREVGILGVREGNNYITDGLKSDIIRRRCCRKAALRGIFLAAGTVADPAKGYHLEIVCESAYMASDVQRLVNSFGLKARTFERRGKSVVYLKEGEQIGDFLSIAGSSGQLFKFQDVRITREMRNKTNRIANCESANLERGVAASQKQLAAIRRIAAARGLEILPDRLYETAKLRLENPELSLAELAELFDPPLKKSGLNHRLAKIIEFAEKMEN